jgi:DNA-binding MarR family transcriptional regulator
MTPEGNPSPAAARSTVVPDARAGRRASGADDRALGPGRAFLHAHARITRKLDDELQANHGLSLAEYDALIQIATAPGRRLRMNLIAQRVLLSRSGVTRLIDRLVAEGLVERVACSTDARGAEAVLTTGGLDRMRAASRTHLAGVQRYYLDVLTPAEREAIERGLGKVQEAAGPTTADCVPGTGEA